MIACVLVPYFAAAVERRDDPSLAGLPLVIGGLPEEPGKVYAVSSEAARRGVQPGMPLHQAQVLCPEAHFLPAAQARYQHAFDQLMEMLAGFTHLVEPGDLQPAATGFLDLGTEWAEAVAVAQRIGETVREQARLAPAISLARNKFTAHVAAAVVEPNEALLIAPGHETAFLAPFPVDFLSLDEETARRLSLLGIRTLGQLAALPAGAVLAQFGKAGQFYQRLAQGRDDRPVLPARPRETERVVHQFGDPVADRTVLESVARAMAGELSARLQARGCMSQKLEMILRLEACTERSRSNAITREDEIVLRQPTSGAEPIAQTLCELLARIRVPCGVVELEVSMADLVPARGQQLDLFVHRAEQESRLRDVLRDLVARYGADCFYRISLTDRAARLPERRFRLWGVDTP